MRLVLKKDWDMQISPPIKDEEIKGHYGGREREVAMLANELIRGKKGSILISGYRGVGKTSLVYKALWRVQETDDSIILILLNSAQLEVSPDIKHIEPIKIMENIIRRLYLTTHKNDDLESVREKINDIYRKAVASNFQETETLFCHDEYSREELKEEKIDAILNEKNLIFITSWTIATLFQFMSVLPWDELNKIIPLLFAFPVPFVVNIIYRESKISKKILAEKDISEECYKFDKNLGTLEFDLEKLHRDITHLSKKLIYIIDELDKLDAKQVSEILSYFKNFFTLSDAIFIFIGGEEIYNLDSLDEKNHHKEQLYRSKNYTYFSSKYFIARPLWDDLKGFLESIVDSINEEDKNQFEILSRALCFDSKNDFYDIKHYIQDRITDFDEELPVIDIDISEEDIQKSRYHKLITILFEEKYMLPGPSKWKENETLFRHIFEHAYNIYSKYAGDLIEDPIGDNVMSEMSRDFNNFLYRIKAFEVERIEQKPKQRDGYKNGEKKQELIPVHTYRYFGRIPNNPPSHFNEPTEFESRFIDSYSELYKYVLSLLNAFKVVIGEEEINEQEFLDSLRNYGTEREIISNSLFDTLITYSDDFKTLSNQADEYTKKRDVTEKNQRGINIQVSALKGFLPNIISNMIRYICPNVNTLRSLKDDNEYFSFMDNTKRLTLRDNRILPTKDKLKQVIFFYDGNQFDEVSKEIKSNSSTHRAILLSEDETLLDAKHKHIVVFKSPEILKSSLGKLLKEIKTFYCNKRKMPE